MLLKRSLPNLRRALTVGAAAFVAIAWSGCSGKKQTELVAGVSSQVQVPRDFRSVRIDVNGAYGNAFCHTYPVYDGKVRLPRTLGVVAGGDPNAPVTITISGFVQDSQDGTVAALNDCLATSEVGLKGRAITAGGGAKVIRRARQPYVADKILFLPMPLRYSCNDVDCESTNRPECSAGDCTCKGGKCVAPDNDPTRFAEYDDSLVFGSTNTCFRPFMTTDDTGAKTPGCLDDGLPPQVVDASKCIYVLPETTSAIGLPPYDAGFPVPEPETHGSGLNVRVVFDNIVSEVLDDEGPCPADGSGAKEGYCIPDPNKPQMFQLAPSLCHPEDPALSDSPHRITLMTASGFCPPKTELQPICDDSVQGPPQPTLLDGGSSADGSCNVATALKPAQSALYILMDKSSGMRNFVGSNSALSQVIGLPLSDPVFSNTLVGFKFLPDTASTCGDPSRYATGLDLPFDPKKTVQTQQAAIAGLIATTPPLTTAPPMQLDAILRNNGAYGALRALGDASKFNSRAVLLLIDRDATNDCGSAALDAVAQASAALTGGDNMATYVIELGNEDLVNISNGEPTTTIADRLAVAGGHAVDNNGTPGSYHVFTNDPNDKTTVLAKANDAIKTIADDLGSCIYEKPPQVTTAAHISAIGPSGMQDLTYSTTACSGDDTTKWVIDQGRIRLCPTPCANLRTALKGAALQNELNGLVPPDLSPTVLELCDAPAGPPVTDGSAPPPDTGVVSSDASAGADGGTSGLDAGDGGG